MIKYRKWAAFLLALAILLAAAGCELPGSEADTSTQSSGEAGGAYEARRVTDLSLVMNGLGDSDYRIFEHNFETDGRLAYTEVRGMLGLIEYRYVYSYDAAGMLNKMDMYVILEDADIAMNYFSSRFTHYCTVEITATENGYEGTNYQYAAGLSLDTNEELAVTVEDGRIKSLQFAGVTAEFDENGRKISEQAGDCYATFSYDEAGNATEMQVSEGSEPACVVTLEYDENGYVKQYSQNWSDGDTNAFTYEIGEDGYPLSVQMIENRKQEDGSVRGSTYTCEYEYTAPGLIGGIAIRSRDHGEESEWFMTHAVTFNEKNLPVTRITEDGQDGTVSSRDEYTWTYDENDRPIRELCTQYWTTDGVYDFGGSSITEFSYDADGRLLEKRETDPNDPTYSSVYTYSYDAEGRKLYEDARYTREDYVSHSTYEYEYHANGELSKRIYLYYDDSDELSQKEVHEYAENGDRTAVREYTYSDGTELLEYTTQYSHVHEDLGNGSSRTTTEAITYDAEGNPIEKTVSITEKSSSGSSARGERYYYENGQWVKV